MTLTESRLNSQIKTIASKVGLSPSKRYDVTSYYKNGMFSKKTIPKCMDAIFADMIFKLSDDVLTDSFTIFNKSVMEFYNGVYNTYGYEHDKHMLFTPTMDIYEITQHPKVLEAKGILDKTRTPKAVKKFYKILNSVIQYDIPHNNQVRVSYLTEAFNTKQADQCLGLRGYGNDISGSIFKSMIEESYSEGMTNLASAAIESRGAVTALFYSSKSIRDAEAFAKATQIVSQFVQKLAFTDCGSTIGISRYVKPPGLNEHGDIYGGDLTGLIGQYYKLKPEDPWELLTADCDHVYNKTIIIRTTVSCKLKDNKSVCIKCFGRHGYTKHPTFNLGQWCCAKVNEPAIQSLLSAKHFIISADGGIYALDVALGKYIKVDNETLTLTKFFNKYKKVVMRVPYQESIGFKNIETLSDVIRVNPERVSSVKKVIFTVTNKRDIEEQIEIKIGVGNKAGVFTSEFLKHVIANKVLDGDDYVIDMTNWNYKTPWMFIPNHVFNYNQLVKTLGSLLGTSKSLSGDTIESMERLINETYDLYNTKLSLHISHLATVIYSLGTVDDENNNYMMKRGIDVKPSSLKKIAKYRSFSSMAPSGTINYMLAIHNVESVLKDPHNLDVLIDPQGFLDNYD